MSNASILLLMNNAPERRRLLQCLRESGFEALGVDTVDQASEQLIAQPWDVLLCAHDPTDEERVSLLITAKWRLPYLARLLLVAESQRAVAQQALKTGIAHLTLIPPVSDDVLRDSIESLLAWSRESRLDGPTPKTTRNSVLRRVRETLRGEKKLNRGPEAAPKRNKKVEWYY